MSRSFGDAFAKQIGVIAEPEIEHWHIGADQHDAYVFVASDGVWEYLSNEQVASIAGKCLSSGASARSTVSEIIRVSEERWKAEVQDEDYCDDITAVLFPIQQVYARAPQPVDSRCCPSNGACRIL